MQSVYLYFNYVNDIQLVNLFIFMYNHLIENNKVKIIFDLNNINLEKDIIICISVESQQELFLKKNNSTVYKMLDDKVEFYRFLTLNKYLLDNDNIKLIPIYTKNYQGENIHKEFMIKHKNGLGSIGNNIEKDHIYSIIDKYDSDDYQIQDVIQTKHIYGINCSCINGEIVGTFTFLKESSNTLFPYVFGEDRKCSNFIKYKNIEHFVRSIVKKMGYNGFVEFEFLLDIQDEFYLMECNPRVTHGICNKIHYENIVVPYINNIPNNSFLWEADVHYNGNLKDLPEANLSLLKKFLNDHRIIQNLFAN